MYNPELKQKYIEQFMVTSESRDIATLEKWLINQFKRSEALEKEHGKDILDMSEEELKTFLREFICGGKGYQSNTLSIIKAYCEWGIKNGFSSLNGNWLVGLSLQNIDVSQSYSNTMVSSEDDLICTINSILVGIDRDTQDNIIRCICLLLFAGVQYEDIWYIKTEDIDLANKSIFYRSKTISMSEALFKVIDHNCKMDQMLIVRRGEIAEQIINEGYLISNTKAYLNDRRRMQRTYTAALSRKLSQSKTKDLTSSSIYDSGVFYRIYLNEMKTGEIDHIEYLWARRNQVSTIEFPDRVKAKCEYEYRIWKESFNLNV